MTATQNCVNLLDLFGKTYRITFDPAYQHRHVPRAKLDPWAMQIPCQGKGVCIYPQGGEVLAAQVDYRPGVARALAAIPGVALQQDGVREKTFLFPLALFGQVAAVVMPRRRRRLSEPVRRAAAERLAKVRPQNTAIG
jgi:hypothetical protein